MSEILSSRAIHPERITDELLDRSEALLIGGGIGLESGLDILRNDRHRTQAPDPGGEDLSYNSDTIDTISPTVAIGSLGAHISRSA